ncbi:MAG: DUF502 domain-containing protein [Opitutales bacterium]
MVIYLRNAFITGLVLLLPLGVTIFVINLLLVNVGEPTVDLIFENVLNIPPPKKSTFNWYVFSLLSTLIVVFLITLLGIASRYFLGRYLITLFERVIDALPFVNAVYRVVKQIVDTFSKQQKAVFQKVVLVEYPRRDAYALGFLTSDAKGEVQALTEGDVVNVFIPTTPNPTSGFLLMIPAPEVIELRMSIGDGMKLIISGGAVVPPYTVDEKQSEPVPLNNPSAANVSGESGEAEPASASKEG